MTVRSGGRCVSSGTVRFGPPAPSLRRPPLRAPLFLFPVPRISPTRDRVPRVFYCCSNGHQKGGAESRRGFDSSSILGGVEQGSSEEEFLVVSFYKFVFIQDPEAEVSKHHSFLQEHDICGRIYVNEQGINAQYSGPAKDALAYAKWLKEDHRFSDILVQTSPSFDGHSFPRLKLRYKPSLVQLEGGIAHLPLLNPMMRATPLSPSEWRKRLQAMTSADVLSGKADSLVSNRNFLLLDVRNGYEWDVGHFQGAQRPNVDCFRSTSFGLSNEEAADSDPLAGVDRKQTDILMYCTGGIRCDIYSTILRQKGFQNLYTLSGGVSNYLKSEGPAEWLGNLFVFDSRLSLPPSIYKPGATANGRPQLAYERSTFARCYICVSQLPELRHRNCANLDCNRLFLSCSSCVRELRGCCCSTCACAPRLRPVLSGRQRYQKWHIYRDVELQKS
uniref:Rhodanese-like domain-containing protein 8, chloroplastic n=1 Tax=Elaeis guineensis var. tenera TaxID=51953 RepID=A0A6I9QHB5_ELAGV|nr:rhodanese-like domain-containing protein 8, chloroplastic [Elaeis guineensis]